MNSDDRSNPKVAAKWAKARAQAVWRDGYKCQVCGSAHRLEVHHKFNWKHYPNRRFDQGNLVTLCRRCHKNFHWWMGGSWRKCTPIHYDRWLSTRSSAVTLWYLNTMMYGIIILMITGALTWILTQ